MPEQAIHPLRDLLFEAAPERAPALLDPAAWPDMSSRLRLSWLQNMLWAYDRTINSLSEYYLSGWLLADAPPPKWPIISAACCRSSIRPANCATCASTIRRSSIF